MVKLSLLFLSSLLSILCQSGCLSSLCLCVLVGIILIVIKRKFALKHTISVRRMNKTVQGANKLQLYLKQVNNKVTCAHKLACCCTVLVLEQQQVIS